MTNENEYIFPDEFGFKDKVLDDYLAKGYYRMQHLMFTTNETLLDYEGQSYPVFWLRTLVKHLKESSAASTIRKKCSLFSVTLKPANVTQEQETLYAVYRNHVNFSTSEFCRDYLHHSIIENPFDSWMIEIRDGTTLIAVGYFDSGKKTIAGILNFYHPEYKNYSLGKFLVLNKIDFALQHQMQYYYTGYISTATTKFDYKLFPDEKAVEVYLPREDKWLPFYFLGKEMLEEYIIG
jgi:arginine-tRNA-protein transferase